MNELSEGYIRISEPKEEGVIFVGNSKEGKSTLICYLAGVPMVLIKNGAFVNIDKLDVEERKKEPVIGMQRNS